MEHLISKYGTLTGKSVLNYSGVYQIERIIEKPSVSMAELELQTPGLRAGYYLCFFGMHVFKPVIFDLLEAAIHINPNTENIMLTPVLEQLAKSEKYLAVEMKGNRYDTTKKLGLMQAQLALGLAGKEKDEVLSSIIQIMAENDKRTSK
jgi:UTP--glucose-1-phosphate uridylyltransferase